MQTTMDPNDGDYGYDYDYDYDNPNDLVLDSYDVDDTLSLCGINSFRNWYDTLQLYIYSLVCAVVVVGHVMVIFSYACCSRKTGICMTMTDVYLINMAVADLVFAMALPVTIFYERNGWPVMGIAACKFARGAYSIKLYCSALFLACLSGDRYMAIVKAKGCSSRETSMQQTRDMDMAQARETSMLQDGDMSQTRESSSMPQTRESSFMLQDGDSSMAQPRERSLVYRLLVSLAIWSLAVILSVPTFIYTTLHQSSSYPVDHDLSQSYMYVDHDLDQTSVDHDLDQSFTEHDDLTLPIECAFNFIVGDLTTMAILVPVQISLGFFLPLLVAGFCCVCITVTLLRTKTFCRREAACMVLTVVFAVCQLPYNAVLLYQVTNGMTQMSSCKAMVTLLMVMEVTRGVAYVHGCLNPILYALTVGVFRRCVQGRTNANWRSPSRTDPAQTQSEPVGPDESPSSSTTVC